MSEKIGIPFFGYIDIEDTEDMLRKQNQILQQEIDRLNSESLTLRRKLKAMEEIND